MSDNQQKSGADCAYIVGQSLFEMATDKSISIKRYDSSSPKESIMAIAQARANFLDPNTFGVEYAQQILKGHLFLRLAKALCENSKDAEELRKFIKAREEYPGLPEIPWILVKIAAQKIDMPDKLSDSPGVLLTDKVENFLSTSVWSKQISVEELQRFCDSLLESYTPEQENVIFRLSSALKEKSLQTHTGSSPIQKSWPREESSNESDTLNQPIIPDGTDTTHAAPTDTTQHRPQFGGGH